MATMSLDKEIMKYLPELDNEEKQSILGVIKSILKLKDANTTHPLGQRLTIEQYNKELEEAEARIDAGEFYTHEEVVEMSKKW